MASMDPVFAALGLGLVDAPLAQGTFLLPPGTGYPTNSQANAAAPWASSSWTAYVQAASVAAATAAMMGQPGQVGMALPTCEQAQGHNGLPAGVALGWPTSAEAMAQQGTQATMFGWHVDCRTPAPPPWQAQCGVPASIDTSPNMTAPAPLQVDSPTHATLEMPCLPDTPRDPASPNGPASPLVLPDVLPAESRQSASSGESMAELLTSDVTLDAMPWPPVGIPAPPPTPPAWPSAQWITPEMSATSGSTGLHHPDMSSAAITLVANLLQGKQQCLPLPPCLPDLLSTVPECSLAAPSTPSAASEKENMPGMWNLREAMQQPISLAKACETPPPKTSSWSFRTDAPCFVPGGVFAETPPKFSLVEATKPQEQTPEKMSLPESDFITARAQMLNLRPQNTPKRELSAAALYTATASFVSGRAPTPPPPPSPPSMDSKEASAASSYILGLVRGEARRSDKVAESRAHIRALAADARAQLACEKDAPPATPQHNAATGRSSRRTRGGSSAVAAQDYRKGSGRSP